MRAAGIIAECNPLHEGHEYLIQKARERTGADYVVVAMSGDYVQRGAPSILSREIRAEALLRAGVDLVVELPLYVSSSGADYFARGGVALLESLGVITDLVFGSESGDLASLQAVAGRLVAEDSLIAGDNLAAGDSSGTEDSFAAEVDPGTEGSPAALDSLYRNLLREGLRRGLSFPQARAASLSVASADGPAMPDTPNDLLGAEYLKALHIAGSKMRPHAVPRVSCSSASEIRAQMLVTRRPEDSFLCRDDFSDLLLHAIYNADSAEGLSRFLDVSHDLAGRILHEFRSFSTYSSFCEAVKTRNYTYTRISRAMLHILLGMTSQTMERFDASYGLCGWIRPIGFKKTALPLIRAITSSCRVPFLDKLARARQVLSDDLYSILLEEIRAEALYDLMAVRRSSLNKKDNPRTGIVTAFQKPLIIL